MKKCIFYANFLAIPLNVCYTLVNWLDFLVEVVGKPQREDLMGDALYVVAALVVLLIAIAV